MLPSGTVTKRKERGMSGGKRKKMPSPHPKETKAGEAEGRR